MTSPSHAKHRTTSAAPDDRRLRPTDVAIACLSVTAIRWFVARDRVVFHLSPDEPGQLAMARFFGGGTVWRMFDHSTRSPGYALLVAPLHWLSDDPTTTFRAALALNAVLGGVAVGLLAVLTHRLTTLSGRWCVVVACIAATLPGALFVTEWTWSESLIPVVVLPTLLTLMWFVDQPSIGRGALVSVSAATANLTHHRLAPLTVTVLVVVWFLVARRRVRIAEAIGITVLCGVLYGAVARFDAWVVDRIWTGAAGINSNDAVVEQLTKFASLPIAAIGQLWYLVVTTVGLAGFGCARLIRAARAPRGAAPTRGDALVVLGSLAPLIALSIVFMADRARPDQIVYGRYSDAVIGPLVAVGLASLLTGAGERLFRRDAAAVAALGTACAVALVVTRSDELATAAVRPMVIGLEPFSGDEVGIAVVRATVISAIVGVTLVAIATRSNRVVAAVAVGALVVVAGLRTERALDVSLNAWATASEVTSVTPTVLRPGEIVRFKQVPPSEHPAASWSSQRHRRMLYQFYLPDNPMVMDGAATAALTPYVFAPDRDPELRDAGATVVWDDPGAPISLWRDP